MIVCAAVLGQLVSPCPRAFLCQAAVVWRCRGDRAAQCRCVQNNPLYLETFMNGSDDDALKFHHVVHCALDAVEERGEGFPARALFFHPLTISRPL